MYSCLLNHVNFYKNGLSYQEYTFYLRIMVIFKNYPLTPLRNVWAIFFHPIQLLEYAIHSLSLSQKGHSQAGLKGPKGH